MSSEDPRLTPEQEARVSHLLADSRAEEPMPPDVADRLDGVLAGLAEESRQERGPDAATVVAITARRRRRVQAMLVAAAAVVVAGVAVGQVVGPDGGEEPTVTSSESSPPTDAAGADGGSAIEAAPEDAAPTYSARDLPPEVRKAVGVPQRIEGREFARAARRLQRHPGILSEAGTMDGADLTAPGEDFMCGAADFGPGKLIAVVYDGSPAVLAFRSPTGDTQVVDLVQCGSGEIVRSVTLSRK